ncbi:MAG: L-serine ammonia-lyase, iron-sulfur-dependent, subunit alpha [Eubacteriales bacterium]|nr:L-serine ammonia-lyase, iron-sulfur-dependent, subunit alpha [Eubacteriales bacterium]
MMYKNGKDLLDYCNKHNCKISDIVMENECKISQISKEELGKKLMDVYGIMTDACHKTLEKAIPSVSGLTGGDAKRLTEYINSGDSLCGKELLTAVSYAMSCFEVNTSMGRIVAAPTAGSCGIVPAVVISIANRFQLSEEEIVRALATAGGIGQIISQNATVSGAEGGCQAECGEASSMAAAAAVEIRGGSPQQALDAAAICLKNVMGLVCDPVAGLVEIPCEKRNAIGVANAYLSSDLALASVRSNIPFDETVEAMYRVGRQLPMELRETAMGGIATCPSALCMRKKVIK